MFSQKYPNLSNFLSSWIAELNDFDDVDISIMKFIKVSSQKSIDGVMSEIMYIKSLDQIPCEDISYESNVYFSNYLECSHWLDSLYCVMRKMLGDVGRQSS